MFECIYHFSITMHMRNHKNCITHSICVQHNCNSFSLNLQNKIHFFLKDTQKRISFKNICQIAFCTHFVAISTSYNICVCLLHEEGNDTWKRIIRILSGSFLTFWRHPLEQTFDVFCVRQVWRVDLMSK